MGSMHVFLRAPWFFAFFCDFFLFFFRRGNEQNREFPLWWAVGLKGDFTGWFVVYADEYARLEANTGKSWSGKKHAT